MRMTGWALTMGVGMAAGAVAAMMLPNRSTARKMVSKAADAVEDVAQDALDMVTQKMGL